MKYRIVTNGIIFKVECKGWFFWHTSRYEDDWGHGERGWYDHEFSTVAAAEEHIQKIIKQNEKPKKTWVVVKEF